MSPDVAPVGIRRQPAPRPLPGWTLWPFVAGILLAWLVPPTAPLLLVVMLAAYAACFVRAPERALIVFVLALPADVLTPSLRLLPGVNFQTGMVATLILAAVMSAMSQPRPGPRNVMLWPTLYYVGILGLSVILAHVYGTAWEHDFVRGWHRLDLGYLVSFWKNQAAYAFLAPVAFVVLKNRDWVRGAVQAVAWATLFISVQAIVQLREQAALDPSDPVQRAAGLLFAQPNILGGFLALMLAILLPVAISAGLGWRERSLYLAAVAATTGSLMLTFSRGSWLGALVGLAAAGVLRRGRVALVLLVVGASAVVWIPESVIDRAKMTFETKSALPTDQIEIEGSARTRLEQWGQLPEMWMEAPILGHGYRSYPRLWGRIRSSGLAQAAHSSIIEFVAEEGLAGLIAYAWFVWILFRSGVRARRSEDPFVAALGVGTAAAACALVVLDASGTRFRNGDLMAYVWIVGGGVARLAAGMPRRATETGPRFRILGAAPRITPGASPASPADPSA